MANRQIGTASGVEEILLNDISKQIDRLTDVIANNGGSGVQSVIGDGVGGTAENVVLTYPTPGDIGAQVALGFTPSRRLLYKNNTSLPTTASAETVLDSFLVPANTFGTADVLNIILTVSKSASTETGSIRVRVNTVNNLTGSPVTIIFRAIGATSTWSKISREMVFKNSLTSETIFDTTNNGSPTDIQSATAATTALTIDFTVNQYILITTQKSASAETVTLLNSYFEIIR